MKTYIDIPSRQGDKQFLRRLISGARNRRSGCIVRAPSGHGKSFLCGEILTHDEILQAFRTVKVKTSVCNFSSNRPGLYLEELGNAVAALYLDDDEFSPLTFLDSRNNPEWQPISNAVHKSQRRGRPRTPFWPRRSLTPSQIHFACEHYLSHVFRSVGHVINIENIQVIDRISLIALRNLAGDAHSLFLLLEYTDDAPWAEWTADALRDFLSGRKRIKIEITTTSLTEVSEEESAKIINVRLGAVSPGFHIQKAGRNLRIADVVHDFIVNNRFTLAAEKQAFDPEKYLDGLHYSEKLVLATIALYGSAISEPLLKDVIKVFSQLHDRDLIILDDIDELCHLNLLHELQAEHRVYINFVHDFDKDTILRSGKFKDLRCLAFKAWRPLLRRMMANILRSYRNGAGLDQFPRAWAAYWHMLVAMDAWEEVKESVRRTLNIPGVCNSRELAVELRRLYVLVNGRASSHDAFDSLRAFLGWRTVLVLYKAMQFEEAYHIAGRLEPDGPLPIILAISLDCMTGNANTAIHSVSVEKSKLALNEHRLPNLDLEKSFMLLLMTTEVHAYLEKWDFDGYQKSYKTVFHSQEEFIDCPCYASFLRLTRPELEGGLTRSEIIGRFEQAEALSRERGRFDELASTLVTFSQVLGDIANEQDDDLLDLADSKLKCAEEISRYVAFDDHSISNNRGALALKRYGLMSPVEDLAVKAVGFLRDAARACSNDYGTLMILSNLALAQAFARVWDPLPDIDRRVRRILMSKTIEDVDMRRRGWLNMGFAFAMADVKLVPNSAKTSAFYLDALLQEDADVEKEIWSKFTDTLRQALAGPPDRPIAEVHYRPTFMAYWHPFIDPQLPWQFGYWPDNRQGQFQATSARHRDRTDRSALAARRTRLSAKDRYQRKAR